jgi:integrase
VLRYRAQTIFTKEQEENCYPLLPTHSTMSCVIIFDTGMRPEEVFRMQVRQIDFTAKQIYIERGKTGTSRGCVPLSDRCMGR